VPPGQDDGYRAAVAAGGQLLDAARTDPATPALLPPRILSVSQVLTYARCPRDFYWSVVRPLPSPPRPAARLGSVVHRLLERRARNLPDLVGADDLGADGAGGAVAPDLVERATRNFAATPYATMPPPDAEVAVVLRVGPWVVRGRIDAIFRGPDGVELVDWKTGRQAAPAADGLDQLGIYALALRELGELPAGACRAAYCYLGGEQPAIQSRGLGPVELDRQRELLEAALQALGRGDYQRACGRPACETCRRDVKRPTAPR